MDSNNILNKTLKQRAKAYFLALCPGPFPGLFLGPFLGLCPAHFLAYVLAQGAFSKSRNSLFWSASCFPTVIFK